MVFVVPAHCDDHCDDQVSFFPPHPPTKQIMFPPRECCGSVSHAAVWGWTLSSVGKCGAFNTGGDAKVNLFLTFNAWVLLLLLFYCCWRILPLNQWFTMWFSNPSLLYDPYWLMLPCICQLKSGFTTDLHPHLKDWFIFSIYSFSLTAWNSTMSAWLLTKVSLWAAERDCHQLWNVAHSVNEATVGYIWCQVSKPYSKANSSPLLICTCFLTVWGWRRSDESSTKVVGS